MKYLIWPIVCATLFTLAGCGGSSEEEAIRWMAEERNQTQPKVAPIPEPKQFVPQSYDNATAVEPFSNQKLTQALKRETSQSTNSALVAPELLRRKEPLESYPLDSMAVVGSIIKNKQPVALVKIDSLLYQVKQGNYLGQNYGRVTKITENEVTLREIVQDSDGEWIERSASLQMQEVTTK
jgi:type IV pilus assembly protein PilP